MTGLTKRTALCLNVALALCGAAQSYAGVVDHISAIEMSREWHFGYPGEALSYNFNIGLEADVSVVSIDCKIPSGEILPMDLDPDDGWWSYGKHFSSPNGLSMFGVGDYFFNITYATGEKNTTSVFYGLPNGSAIPQVTQEPVLLNPLHLDKVSPNLTLYWEACVDPNAQKIGFEWQPANDVGASGEAYFGVSPTSYGPILLTPDVDYVLQFSFDFCLNGRNLDGIPYWIDTDSERKYLVSTVPEPASIGFFALGVLALLRRRR
jgi:hypothetical protein